MPFWIVLHHFCLLYTSDAADERSSVDLGGRRIIKKKTKIDYDGDPNDQKKQPNKTYNIQAIMITVRVNYNQDTHQ